VLEIYGSSGDDTIDGGVGTDSIYFSGSRENYFVTDNDDGSYTVEDLRDGSPDGIDTISNFENIRFSDGTVAPDDLVAGNPEIVEESVATQESLSTSDVVTQTQEQEVEVEATRDVVDTDAMEAAGYTQIDGEWTGTREETFTNTRTEIQEQEVEVEATRDVVDIDAMETAGYIYIEDSTVTSDIDITNASFETSNLVGGRGGKNESWDNDVDGWSQSGSAGDYNQGTQNKWFKEGETTGENVAYVGKNSQISQTLDENLSDDTTYTLNIDIGHSNWSDGQSNEYSIKLVAGGEVVSEITQADVSEVKGEFVTATIVVNTADFPDGFNGFGEPIKIEIDNFADKDELYIDNVSMSKTELQEGHWAEGTEGTAIVTADSSEIITKDSTSEVTTTNSGSDFDFKLGKSGDLEGNDSASLDLNQSTNSVKVEFKSFHEHKNADKGAEVTIEFYKDDVKVGETTQEPFGNNGKNSVTYSNDKEFDEVRFATNDKAKLKIEKVSSTGIDETTTENVTTTEVDTEAMEAAGWTLHGSDWTKEESVDTFNEVDPIMTIETYTTTEMQDVEVAVEFEDTRDVTYEVAEDDILMTEESYTTVETQDVVTDTLIIGEDMQIDMSGLSDAISNIETIDLGAGEQNITSLSTEDVLDMTDTDNLLRIDGDSTDSIDLNTQGDDAEWKLGEFQTTDEITGETYNTYTSVEGDDTVTLEISTDIQVDQN